MINDVNDSFENYFTVVKLFSGIDQILFTISSAIKITVLGCVCYLNDLGYFIKLPCIVCCCLVAKSCLILCSSIDSSSPGSSVLHYLPELFKLMSIELMILPNHLILCRPILLPSIFPIIRVFPIGCTGPYFLAARSQE